MRRTTPLAISVAWISALVIAAAMLVYAVYQFFTMPNMPFWRLLVEHTWHVLVLGALTYAVLHFLLNKKVVKPVRQLSLKLYGISRGDERTVDVATNIREIRDIADSVNLMLSQLHRTSNEPWVEKLRNSAGVLRALSGKVSDTMVHSDREMLVHTAGELEELATLFERFEAKAQNMDHEFL